MTWRWLIGIPWFVWAWVGGGWDTMQYGLWWLCRLGSVELFRAEYLIRLGGLGKVP